MKDIHEQTYYELLEVSPNASQEEILQAYNRARATYGHNSPALYSVFNKDEAKELLRLIDEAYSVLSNQFKRQQYDSKPKPAPVLKEKPVSAPVQEINRFGEYRLDQNFENEIKNREIFDGPFLQKVRIYKNISVDQISEAIKISRAYLAAIESDNYPSLPATVFTRGFLVQYAKVLGLDTEKVASSYLKKQKEQKQR